MKNNEASFWSRIPDSVKVAIGRWWFAGAMYFLLAWGLLGEFSSIDQMFFIGLGIGVAHIFVLHPLVYSMFNIKRNGKIVNKKYYERTILEGVFVKLGEIFKCIVCSFIVGFTYVGINMAINSIFGYSDDTIKFGGEPIMYGLFFMLCYVGISFLTSKIALLHEKINEKRKQNKIIKNEESGNEE